MLSSVFHMLAIIGIVLLCIIAFLLVVLLAVLFVPIRYRLCVEKEDGWKKENIHIRADISWLAGIVRVKARFFEPQIFLFSLCISLHTVNRFLSLPLPCRKA